MRLTFQELLTSVFLEERLVSHWSMEVVDEQVEDRLDLVLRVAGKLSESLVL